MSGRKLLLYAPQDHSASHRLQEAMAAVVPEQTTEVVHTAAELVHRLRSPINGLEMAVILAASRKKLRELVSLDRMLENLRLILILPDTDPKTIAQGHSLRPRYLSNIQSDFQDVAGVLRKMLASSQFSAIA